MAGKQSSNQALELYEKLLATIPEIERKGVTMPFTSLNGNMFSFLDRDGNVNLRLDENKRKEFTSKFNSKPSVQHGVVMREYVAVPDKLLASTKELERWLGFSYAYAASLKPKKTKK